MKKVLILLTVAISLAFSGCNHTPTIHKVVVTNPDYRDTSPENLAAAHNEIRKQHHRPVMTVNPLLTKAAQKHAVWMAENKRMSHTGEHRSSPFKRISDEGYEWRAAGENVAMGYEDVEDVMNGWMHSAGHRANILNDYKEFGVGVAMDDKGTIYWCVDFGTSGIYNVSSGGTYEINFLFSSIFGIYLNCHFSWMY